MRGSLTRALSGRTWSTSRSLTATRRRSGVWTRTCRRSGVSCGPPPSLALAASTSSRYAETSWAVGHVQLGPVEEQLLEVTKTRRFRFRRSRSACDSWARTDLRRCPVALRFARTVATRCRRKTQIRTCTSCSRRCRRSRWSVSAKRRSGGSKWRIARTSAQRRLWTQSTQTNSV